MLTQANTLARPTGGLGIPGLYVPADPGAPDEQSKKGQILISFGKLFEKVRLDLKFCDLFHPDIDRVSRWALGSATSKPITDIYAT